MASLNSRTVWKELYVFASLRDPVCLSVTFVYPTQPVEIFHNFIHRLVRWPSTDIHRKFYGDRPKGMPLWEELTQDGKPNTAILDLSKAISRKWRKIGGKLVLVNNRKSYMSFRLVQKSVTLNDLERRNGPYSALFH